MPILVGLDGVEKMSKSLGNYIGVNEPPEIMFKKVMEVPDKLIIHYFELVTDEHPDTIKSIEEKLASGINPKDVKLILADIITKLYHGEKEAKKARQYYEVAFGKKAIPDDIPELMVDLENGTIEGIVPQLIAMGMVQSKSEFIRLVKQNGVQVDGEKINLDNMSRVLCCGDVLRIGKKKFLKLVK